MTKINKFFFFLVVAFYLLLGLLTILGMLAPKIPIGWLPQLQLLPIIIPYLFIPHLLFVIYFINHRAWLLMLFAIGCLAACVWIAQFELRWNSKSGNETNRDLRVVTYNVQGFHTEPLKHLNTVVNILQPYRPDVVAFQEFKNKNSQSDAQALARISDQLDLPYREFVVSQGSTIGCAILSRYPIIQNEMLYSSSQGVNVGMWSVIETPRGRVGVYNFHLASYRLQRELRRNKELKWLIRNFWDRAAEVIPEQKRMAQTIYDHSIQHEGNIIIVGDLNSVPYTRIPSMFRSTYQDSFLKKGMGYGITYPIKRLLGMRIDYQFASDSLQIIDHQIIRQDFSDHFPVIVDYLF